MTIIFIKIRDNFSHWFCAFAQLEISHILIGTAPKNQNKNRGHRTFLSFRPYIGMAALVTCVEFFIAMVLCCSTVTTIWLTDWGNVSFHYANFLFFLQTFFCFSEKWYVTIFVLLSFPQLSLWWWNSSSSIWQEIL